MITKGIFTQQIRLTTADVDRFRRLRMSALFRMLQQSSIQHTEALGAGRAKTLDRGALWVLSRMRVSVTRLPVYDDIVTLYSWPGETMHSIFPRYYKICAADGSLLLQASGLWLLMDQRTRHMAFPDELGIIVPGVVTGEETPLPEGLSSFDAPVSVVHSVCYSEVDLNGHVNNTQYLNWLDDQLPMVHHADHIWETLQINYHNEIPPDATVRIEFAQEDNCCRMCGFVGETRAYQIVGHFREVTDS